MWRLLPANKQCLVSDVMAAVLKVSKLAFWMAVSILSGNPHGYNFASNRQLGFNGGLFSTCLF